MHVTTNHSRALLAVAALAFVAAASACGPHRVARMDASQVCSGTATVLVRNNTPDRVDVLEIPIGVVVATVEPHEALTLPGRTGVSYSVRSRGTRRNSYSDPNLLSVQRLCSSS
jgi:hypothetical protein